MYSDSRYSLVRYSVNRADKTIEIVESFSESVGGMAGAAVPIDFRDRYEESSQGSVRGTVSVISAFSTSGDLAALVKMSANEAIRDIFSETLQTVAYGSKDAPVVLAFEDRINAPVWGSKDIPAALPMADVLTARTAGSKNVPTHLQAVEILTSILEATSQTTERTTLQLSIPPGGELRIDSELFLVLLNGENALHTQSGDWINISRNLLRLIVESASGGQLRGQLIYTERFL